MTQALEQNFESSFVAHHKKILSETNAANYSLIGSHLSFDFMCLWYA